MLKSAIAALTLAALLAACASGPPRTPRAVIDRALATAPGAAQPSRIVAAELAFARAAREQGQWTAFRETIAPGGVLHGRGGPFAAEPWLAQQANPAEAVAWAPRAVWMSCDGKLAVSRGRLREPDGRVGTFATVWQQQDSGDYRWIYDIGGIDDPQPPPTRQPEGDEILVVAEELIQGHVADCPPRGTAVPPPAVLHATTARYDGGLSPDGTLAWRWEHQADGTRRIAVQLWRDGAWQDAMTQDWPPARTE